MSDGELEWEWDVEDCVVVTNGKSPSDDNKEISVDEPRYKGYNPYE